MTTTTTTVDVGTPPTIRPPWTAPAAVDYRETLTPHRELPDTGNTATVVGVALVAVIVGVTLARWARRHRRPAPADAVRTPDRLLSMRRQLALQHPPHPAPDAPHGGDQT